jgi:hypothetical protein
MVDGAPAEAIAALSPDLIFVPNTQINCLSSMSCMHVLLGRLRRAVTRGH